MLKHGRKKQQTVLHKISDMIITHHAKLPTQLYLSEIIVLFKKGDLLDCNNYRPICLVCHVYKLVTMILYRRISSELSRAGRILVSDGSVGRKIDRKSWHNLKRVVCGAYLNF